MMSRVTTIIARTPGETLNMDLSRTKAFGLTLGPRRLMRIMMIIVNIKARPMQIWNGIS